jgi:hypothetical protein
MNLKCAQLRAVTKQMTTALILQRVFPDVVNYLKADSTVFIYDYSGFGQFHLSTYHLIDCSQSHMTMVLYLHVQDAGKAGIRWPVQKIAHHFDFFIQLNVAAHQQSEQTRMWLQNRIMKEVRTWTSEQIEQHTNLIGSLINIILSYFDEVKASDFECIQRVDYSSDGIINAQESMVCAQKWFDFRWYESFRNNII